MVSMRSLSDLVCLSNPTEENSTHAFDRALSQLPSPSLIIINFPKNEVHVNHLLQLDTLPVLPLLDKMYRQVLFIYMYVYQQGGVSFYLYA